MQRLKLTLVELLIVFVVMILLAALTLPALIMARERGRRANCMSNLKQIGQSLSQYASQNLDYFPTGSGLSNDNNFEAMNISGVMPNSEAYGCPSFAEGTTLASNSDYIYVLGGLTDRELASQQISGAYDRAFNHPQNQWMNVLFMDGHIEGATPDSGPNFVNGAPPD